MKSRIGGVSFDLVKSVICFSAKEASERLMSLKGIVRAVEAADVPKRPFEKILRGGGVTAQILENDWNSSDFRQSHSRGGQ